MEWISVKDRLPDITDDYLVTGDWGMFIFYFDTHWMKFNESDGPRNHSYVTHWMPLPKLPQNIHEK